MTAARVYSTAELTAGETMPALQSELFAFAPTGWPHIDKELDRGAKHLRQLAREYRAHWLTGWIEDIQDIPLERMSERFNAFHQAVMLAQLSTWLVKIEAREAA